MTQSIADYQELANLLDKRMKNREGGNNQRLAIMLGMLPNDKDKPIKANIPSKDRSQFSLESYKFMLDAPFEISNRCCDVMKKEPIHRYARETERMPITAQMASESRLRTQVWLRNGCNAFNVKNPISNPMSFWTEQDVLRYIKDKGLKICSVYGEVVTDDEEMGQMQLSDYAGMELFEIGQQCLHCTGCDRTGCVLCGFGAHIQNDDRFLRLKETHPKMYALLDVVQNNGYTMRQAIDWISEHSNKVIRY
jgi:3'-phosphoadenosine 5'-phosphosulfate sulfotransferase (PAPS reductase)/FAD synthetase